MVARAYIGGGDPVAPQRATGPCRPWGGRPLSPVGGRQALFLPGTSLEFEEKKLHLGPVALWEGDRGIFLKYFKTDIFF